jgi:hypothetical protein
MASVARASTHVTRNSRAPASLPGSAATRDRQRRNHINSRVGQLLEDITFIICIVGLASSVICAIAALLGII